MWKKSINFLKWYFVLMICRLVVMHYCFLSSWCKMICSHILRNGQTVMNPAGSFDVFPSEHILCTSIRPLHICKYFFCKYTFCKYIVCKYTFCKKCLKRIGSREEGHLRRLLTQRRYLLSLDHYILQYKTTKEISVLKKFQKLEDVEQTCFVFNELKLLLTLSFRWHNTFRNIGY